MKASEVFINESITGCSSANDGIAGHRHSVGRHDT